MASVTDKLYIKSADGNQNLYANNSFSFSGNETLGYVLSTYTPSVTSVSNTMGGTAIDNTLNMGEVYSLYAGAGVGVILYDVTPQPQTYKIVKFVKNGVEYCVPCGGGGAVVEGLVVGGGGGSHGYYNYNRTLFAQGGGGGGGGVVCIKNYAISEDVCVVVGAGGTLAGCNGGDSCFGNVVAYGGGGGGGFNSAGLSGGSGGGGGAGYSGAGVRAGGTSCPLQGTSGNIGNTTSTWGGCAGGGGGAGGFNTTNTQCGGLGICSDIDGANKVYSCGGTPSGGISNVCGGGSGGGLENCGGGGNGVVIVRYPIACGYNMSGGCKYTCGDYTIHCFTSDGTLSVN